MLLLPWAASESEQERIRKLSLFYQCFERSIEAIESFLRQEDKMSSVTNIESVCAICGAKKDYPLLTSIHHSGNDDLDLRPGGIHRGSMFAWVQECPSCGYISENISDPSSVTKHWLRLKKFRSCDGIRFKSEMARTFFKKHMIDMEDGNKKGAFFALVHTAWLCDDANDPVNADQCRKRAIILADKLLCDDDEGEKIRLIRMDLMRRAGCFKQMIEEYSLYKFDNELWDEIRRFQIEKAKEKDTGVYDMDDVEKRFHPELRTNSVFNRFLEKMGLEEDTD